MRLYGVLGLFVHCSSTVRSPFVMLDLRRHTKKAVKSLPPCGVLDFTA